MNYLNEEIIKPVTTAAAEKKPFIYRFFYFILFFILFHLILFHFILFLFARGQMVW